MSKVLVRRKRKDGVVQGYWITKKRVKKYPLQYAKFEYWKDDTIRIVVRDTKGHFVTWKIIKIPPPPPPPPPDEDYIFRVDFDIRFEKES